MSSEALTDVKSRVSAAVMKLPGVAGLELPSGGVTVYLEIDTPERRQRIGGVIDALELPVSVHLEVTRKFGR